MDKAHSYETGRTAETWGRKFSGRDVSHPMGYDPPQKSLRRPKTCLNQRVNSFLEGTLAGSKNKNCKVPISEKI